MAGKEEIETGNKVLLPSSVLHQLSQYRLPNPLLFTLQNTIFGNSTNVGVLEFTAEEGNCYVPTWMFDVLNLDFGMEVNLMLVTSVPRGKFIKVQPHQTAFIDLPDPRAVLEKNLARYTCLTKGETICIKVADRAFMLDILEIKPDNPVNCICVIEADVEVDFAPPLDYKEPEPNLIKQPSNLQLDDQEEEEPQGPFQGKGIKLNGQVVKDDPTAKKKVTNDEYDPRKHRLPNGVRQTIIKDDFKDLKVGLVLGKTAIQTVISGSTKGPQTMSPVPLLKKHSSIAGSTGHSHAIHDEPSIKSINPSMNRTGSINKPNESVSKGASGQATQGNQSKTTLPTNSTSTSNKTTGPTTTTQPTQSKPSYTGGTTASYTGTSTSYTSTSMGVSKGSTTQPTQVSKPSSTQPSGGMASYTTSTSSTNKPTTTTTPSIPTRTTSITSSSSNKPTTTTTSTTSKTSSNLSYTSATKK
eukprot:CAMPEP_0176425566 /NCGR_PEP_ID=MMETSP0127-20121128/11459_1 /TAXON_ID=938130 /ORGANISM="Platyophrya macrostoma, Strain WH" /LENGTH=468 /DNA_ID=CAMNT_0017806739 /DNA_START=155 /DNA_END=1561 /DNA_ORIENTATION=-